MPANHRKRHSGGRRYQSGAGTRYSNPYYKKKRSAPRKSFRIGFILWGFILIAGFSYLMITPSLYIENIDIDGAQLSNKDGVMDRVGGILEEKYLGVIPKSHILFVPSNEISSKLERNFPVTSVEVKRQYKLPPGITVRVGEREPAFRLYYMGDHFSVIDNQGFIVFSEIGKQVVPPSEEGETDVPESNEIVEEDAVELTEDLDIPSVVECTFCDTFSFLPLISVSSTPPALFSTNDQTLPPSTITTLFELYNLFDSYPLPVKEMFIDGESPETVEMRLLENLVVYLDLSKDINAQYGNLRALLDEKYPTQPRGLQYIDVRYGNRLYYQ